MVRVNGNNGVSQQKGSGKTPQNPEYMKKQMEYKSHIKKQAENLDDLKNAAKWKQKQIDLAKEYERKEKPCNNRIHVHIHFRQNVGNI